MVKSGKNIFWRIVATEKSSDFPQPVERNAVVFKEARRICIGLAIVVITAWQPSNLACEQHSLIEERIIGPASTLWFHEEDFIIGEELPSVYGGPNGRVRADYVLVFFQGKDDWALGHHPTQRR